MFRQKYRLSVVALAAMLIVSACGGNAAEPEAAPPAAEAVPAAAEAAVEAEAEVDAAAEAVTDAAAVTETETMTETEAVTETAAMTDTVATEPSADADAAGEGSAQANIVSARPVPEIVGEREAPLAAVSPDGAHIAWIQRSGRGRSAVGQLCIFTFVNAGRACHEAPEDFQAFPYQLYWSPDSSAIAFTENPIDLGAESDVWTFSVADAAFTNRTDDGVTGSWTRSEEPALLDVLPMWNAADGSLYSWRVEPLGAFQYNLGIYSLGATEGEAELVVDLSDALPGVLPMFSQNRLSMDGMAALSPDGAQAAALLTDMTADAFGTTTRSLYLIDLSDDAAAPQQIMTAEDFQVALPAWQTLPADPQGLSWTNDGSAIVVNAFSNDTHSPLNIYYYVDVADGTAVPVVDFSGAESLSALFDTEINNIPLRFYAPWSASLNGDGTSLIMFNDLGGTAGILEAPLPPSGELPALLGTAQSNLITGTGTRTSRSSSGKIILSNNMFTFE